LIIKSANIAWADLLLDVASSGTDVRPRDILCREIVGYPTRIDMSRPVVTNRARKLGYRFMLTEAAWIIKGQYDLKTLADVNPNIAQFSDDGNTMSGAYGPRLEWQVPWLANTIAKDNDTRQAVATIWRPKPEPSKDIPCTVAIQILVRRDSEGVLRLNLVDTMRSSDAWLGWPYDVFSFSMFGAYMALRLREQVGRFSNIQLGGLFLNAGSQHIYTEPKENSRLPYDLTDVMRVLGSDPEEVGYSPLDLSKLDMRSEDFGDWLLNIRDGTSNLWLQDLREQTWGRSKVSR
jgi:thymidylate synthase